MTGTSGRIRPAGLREVTLLMCLFNLAGLVVIRPREMNASAFYVICGAFVLISFVVLWHFWNGRNWARWLVLATSVLCLVNLSVFGSVTAAERFLLVIEAALGVWLLFWLNTRSVRAFFRNRIESGAA